VPPQPCFALVVVVVVVVVLVLVLVPLSWVCFLPGLVPLVLVSVLQLLLFLLP
jgi:hypothetical protein